MKKIISVILAAAMLLCLFASCGKDEHKNGELPDTETENSRESVLRLAYSNNEELNPFTAEAVINIQIMGLVYDGLYKLNKNYEPEPLIAKSAIVAAENINVTLNSVNFSDGSPVTAGDVIYSFELAKNSPYYRTKLANFLQVDLTAQNMVMFRLNSPDPYALSCLTFPIVKTGSEGEMPIGCGRYQFQKSGESVYLIVNTQKSGFKPTIKTITLDAIKENGSIESSLEIGNTGFFYDDLGDGTFSRINAHTVEMGINHFVYLGFNPESSVFGNSAVRKAVNLAVNRSEIASNAFQGHARETYTPFNPDWYALISKDLIVSRDIEAAKAAVEEVDPEKRDISLLVNSENSFKLEAAGLIQQYLDEIGFVVTVKDYNAEYYKEALEIGSYDLYLGEYKLTPNMDLTPLFGGSIGGGIFEESESTARYSQLLRGECELMDFINTFNEDLPIIPLCYRNAAVSYTNSMNADYACCDGDIFYDIETWRYK